MAKKLDSKHPTSANKRMKLPANPLVVPRGISKAEATAKGKPRTGSQQNTILRTARTAANVMLA
jgi:hypothetical protein